MFLIPMESQAFKFNTYKILMIILVLLNILVCNNSFDFENFLQKIPYKM